MPNILPIFTLGNAIQYIMIHLPLDDMSFITQASCHLSHHCLVGKGNINANLCQTLVINASKIWEPHPYSRTPTFHT